MEYRIFKVFMWVSSCLFGAFVGKYFVHGFLLNGILRLNLFKDDKGSWSIMLFSITTMLYCFSLIFNHIAKLDSELKPFQITNQMNIRYKTFMNGVGLVSFFSHLLFSLMITDTILQVSEILLCNLTLTFNNLKIC